MTENHCHTCGSWTQEHAAEALRSCYAGRWPIISLTTVVIVPKAAADRRSMQSGPHPTCCSCAYGWPMVVAAWSLIIGVLVLAVLV